jgi:hypothetical protein
MIEVTIKLVPFGQAQFTRTIGTITIFNDGTSKDPNIGNYTFIATTKHPVDNSDVKVVSKVFGHARKRNIFFLLLEVLKEAIKTEDANQIGSAFMDYLVKPLKDRK